MGNNMMGGDFSWAFIIQAMLVGLLFIIGNYYLWIGMRRIPGADRYQKYIKYYIVVLVVCVAVWLTPRNLPLSPGEQLALGGQVHPLLGALGLMSTKNAVINLIILTTFLSFLLYRRANKIDAVPLQPAGARDEGARDRSRACCASGILGWYAGVLFRLDPAALDLAPEKIAYFRFTGGLVAAAMVASWSASGSPCGTAGTWPGAVPGRGRDRVGRRARRLRLHRDDGGQPVPAAAGRRAVVDPHDRADPRRPRSTSRSTGAPAPTAGSAGATCPRDRSTRSSPCA